MRETAQQHPDDFPAAFDRAFAALQVCVETACAAEAEWARGVAAGVRAALAFAAADPPSAWILALASHAAGREGIDRYYRMLDYFGDLLAPGRDLHPENGPLPAVTERAMIGGLASRGAEGTPTRR